jgi:hypothetical protein
MSTIISLAGQTTALCASNIKIKDARVTPFGGPRLDIAETELFAAFNAHQFLSAKPDKEFKRHFQSVDYIIEDDQVKQMLVAQLRVILAGNHALQHADFSEMGGTPSFIDSKAWHQNEAWASALTAALLKELDLPKEWAYPIDDVVWGLAQQVVGDNWTSVRMHIAILAAGYDMQFAKPRHLSPITPEMVNRAFDGAGDFVMAGL